MPECRIRGKDRKEKVEYISTLAKFLEFQRSFDNFFEFYDISFR